MNKGVNQRPNEPLPSQNQIPSEGKPKRKRLTALRKKTLKEIRANPSATAGGAFALRSRYLNDSIHRGSIIWLREIAPKEREWAGFLGYSHLEAAPISIRSLVRLWVADWLLTSFYTPSADAIPNVKEVRAAMNSLRRLTLELHKLKEEQPDFLKVLSEEAS